MTKMLNRSSKVVGSKQVLKGMSEGSVRCVIIASDADTELKKKLVEEAFRLRLNVMYAPSMARLGEAAGLEVAAAAVGIGSEEENI